MLPNQVQHLANMPGFHHSYSRIFWPPTRRITATTHADRVCLLSALAASAAASVAAGIVIVMRCQSLFVFFLAMLPSIIWRAA